MIMWNVDTEDWKTRNTQKTIQAVIGKVRDGDIVLMHELYRQTGAAAEVIIPKLVEQGYQLVTVSELARYRGGVKDGYGIEPILLIDEYDQPIMSSYEYSYRDQLGPFFSNLYGSAMKGNSSLSQALITGVQRVPKESIFSQFNNPQFQVLVSEISGIDGLDLQRMFACLLSKDMKGFHIKKNGFVRKTPGARA